MIQPKISIILPTYNGKEDWISKSINSVLNQTYKNFELIIINDASTNDIEKTILKFQKKDPRIIYYKNEKNLKLSKTLNKGIELAKGEYIARIDDDDIWVNKDKLEKQVDFMEKNPEYGLCGCAGFTIIDENENIISKSCLVASDNEIRNRILIGNPFIHSSVIIRKSILDCVGMYNEYCYPAEDYDLRCRIGKKYKLVNLKNLEILYRININGMTQKNSIKMKKMAIKIVLKNKNFYPNFYKALLNRIILGFILPEKFVNYIVKIKKHLGESINFIK